MDHLNLWEKCLISQKGQDNLASPRTKNQVYWYSSSKEQVAKIDESFLVCKRSLGSPRVNPLYAIDSYGVKDRLLYKGR